MGPSANSRSADQIRLQLLYDEQANLFERKNIHQHNLQEKLRQEALYGINVPLDIKNEITLQKAKIREVDQELARVEREIAEIIRRSAAVSPSSEGPLARIRLNGVDYLIEAEAPFPPLGLQNIALPDGQMEVIHRYVGGFEVSILTHPDHGMRMSFHRHGREVSPLIDTKASKLKIPRGNYVKVNAVALTKWHHTDMAGDVPPEARAKDWNILPPSDLQRIVSNFDWPLGFKECFVTSQIVFENGYEVWAVADSETKEPCVWFYLDDWNVRPVADMERSTLAFPRGGPSGSKIGDVPCASRPSLTSTATWPRWKRCWPTSAVCKRARGMIYCVTKLTLERCVS